MNRLLKKISIALIAMFSIVGLAACAPAQPVDMSKVTAVIDVRSASEYASGHLQGAVNIDVQSATFTDEISKLNKSGTYVLYCHSGKRAGEAKDIMTGLGFTSVTNAGGYADASESTKLPIVN